MRKVRFAPSPTGSLHVGNALSAVANRAFGDWLLLRIDDTDPERNMPGGEDAIIADLAWLGVEWDEGPVRQSERAARYTEAGRQLGDRFDGITLLREELGLPKHDVHYDLPRIRRLAIEAIAELPDGELADAAEAPIG